jgi:hypothetical protein
MCCEVEYSFCFSLLERNERRSKNDRPASGLNFHASHLHSLPHEQRKKDTSKQCIQRHTNAFHVPQNMHSFHLQSSASFVTDGPTALLEAIDHGLHETDPTQASYILVFKARSLGNTQYATSQFRVHGPPSWTRLSSLQSCDQRDHPAQRHSRIGA